MKKKAYRTCILGLGERSTQYYVSTLHKKYHDTLGDYHTFPFLLYQIDFNVINPFLPDQFDTLVPELTNIIKTISDFKASQYLIPNITLHETLDKINHQLHIVHPVQLTIKHCKTHNINKIALFGSRYTMTSNYITNALTAAGINVVKPSEEDQLLIDDFRTKTYRNSETDSDFKVYHQLIQKHTKSYPVVTACTELSLHHERLDNSNVIDMALLQIETVLTQELNKS